jgi:uncharacterized membrane protein YqjE
MAEPTVPPPSPDADKSVAELVFDVSERASSLVREEIELAKTEVSEKVGSILRGSVVGIVAGTFAFLALILAMHGVAWLINDLFFDEVWPGYFIEAALFLLIAAAAGFFAYRSVQAGAPPVPEQAIAEAKRTRAMLQGEPVQPAPGTVQGPGPAQAPDGEQG